MRSSTIYACYNKQLKVNMREIRHINNYGQITFTVSNLSSFRTSSLFFCISFLRRRSIPGLSFALSFNNWLSIICLLLLLLLLMLKGLLWVITIVLLLLLLLLLLNGLNGVH